MPGWLRRDTAIQPLVGPFISDTDFKTPQTGLTITSAETFLIKNSAAHGAKNDATSAAHAVNGDYYIFLNATDTNTVGILRITIAKTGCLPVWDSFMVLAPEAYDALVSGSPFHANVLYWQSAAVATPHTAGYPVTTIKDGTGTGELDTASGVVLAKDHAGANLATAAQIAALENVSAAQVKAQVVDALTVDTYAEPGQTAPPATLSILGRLQFLYKAFRNKRDQTGVAYKLYNDAGDTVDQKASASDDDVTYQRGKIGSGP